MREIPQLRHDSSEIIIKESPPNGYNKGQKSRFQKTGLLASLQTQNQQITLEEYQKLEQLLQNTEASLREHFKHEHQLKLYIQDMQEKNKFLDKNNQQILNQYKKQVSHLKKQNEELRKTVKHVQNQNRQIKKNLKNVTNSSQKQNIQSFTPRLPSQTVIKVIESEEIRNSMRQSTNSKLLTFNSSAKESPFPCIQDYDSGRRKGKNQSKQKLKVTMKNSKIFEQGQNNRILTPDRNQKQIPNQGLLKHEQNQKAIKRIIQLKKWNLRNNEQQILTSKKQLTQRNGKNHRHSHSLIGQNENISKQRDQQNQEKKTIRKLAKQTAQQLIQTSSKSTQQRIEVHFSTRRNNVQQDLIKLGHYGSNNVQISRPKPEKVNS